MPACDIFTVFEIGTSVRALTNHRVPSSSEVPEDGGNIASFDIGLMWNRPDRTALGAALELGLGEWPRRRYAIELRRRKWLTGRTAFDVAVGPLLINTNDSKLSSSHQGGTSPGLTSHAGLVFADLVAVTAGLDYVHRPRNQVTLTVGGRLGTWAAIAGMGVGMLSLIGLARAD